MLTASGRKFCHQSNSEGGKQEIYHCARMAGTKEGCSNKFKWLVMKLEFGLADKEIITLLFHVVLSAWKAALLT